MKNKKKKGRPKKPFIDYVKYWNECKASGNRLKYDEGLCYDASKGYLDRDLLRLFAPTDEDNKWLKWEERHLGYWASDNGYKMLGIFTKLRETIVLFMAAIKRQL